MAIIRNYGEVNFHCDSDHCHEVFESETKDFAIALERYNASDWITRREADRYAHVCPTCQESEVLDALPR